MMFRILELGNTGSAPAIELGQGFATQAEALAAVKKHLKGFKVSGHNPDENYWWARNSEGLRKCWISSTE
jgi:hypothetical protein